MTERTAEKIVEISSFIVTKSLDIAAMYVTTFGSAFIIKSGFDAADEDVGNGLAKILGGVCAFGGLGVGIYVDSKVGPIVEEKMREFMYTFVEE